MNNDQIITIDEAIGDKFADMPDLADAIKGVLIAFAKMHVSAALKAASKTDYVLDSSTAQEEILNCYSLDNIR